MHAFARRRLASGDGRQNHEGERIHTTYIAQAPEYLYCVPKGHTCTTYEVRSKYEVRGMAKKPFTVI